MKISFFNNSYFNNVQNRCINQQMSYPNLAPLQKDVVSFGAMKKTQFEGADFLVVERFKAPIEKFKTYNDFQNWCRQQLDVLLKKDYSARQPETDYQRESLLKEWKTYLLEENCNYSNAIALLVLSAITKNLKPNNDNIPPVLNKGALADCVSDIEESLMFNKKFNLDFNKMYNTKLKAIYLEDTNINEIGTKWIKILSEAHDPKNFKKNVDKLKALSHKNWCTKSFNAEPYLKDGDFHVYLENGQPKLGVRFLGNKIEEIQGPANNGKIPVVYLNIVKEHIAENNLKVSENAKQEIIDAEKIKTAIDKITSDLKDAIKNNDVKTILEYFGIKVTVDNEGFYIISNYKQPSSDFTFSDIGVDEQKLFSKIKKITGKAVFEDSAVSNFTVLEEIGGDADFQNSKITDLGTLKIIGKNARFNMSPVKSLGNLQEIGRNLVLNDEIEDLNKLEYIGGNVNFSDTKVKSLGELREIGGNAEFVDSEITDLGYLELIGHVANFRNSKIKSLGNLKTIGSDAIFENSQVEDLGKIEDIEGDVYIGNSKLSVSDFEKSDDEYFEEIAALDDDFPLSDFEFDDIVHGRIYEDVEDYYD